MLKDHMKWDLITLAGENRLVKSSYIWLILVPVGAKFFELTESPLDFTNYVDGLKLKLELSFSWKLFYASAVIFSITNIIYFFVCPEIIRKYRTFESFQQDGNRISHLRKYAAIGAMAFSFPAAEKMYAGTPTNHQSELLETLFWEVRAEANRHRMGGMIVCGILYASGLIIIGGVLLDNFLFVVEQW